MANYTSGASVRGNLTLKETFRPFRATPLIPDKPGSIRHSVIERILTFMEVRGGWLATHPRGFRSSPSCKLFSFLGVFFSLIYMFCIPSVLRIFYVHFFFIQTKFKIPILPTFPFLQISEPTRRNAISGACHA